MYVLDVPCVGLRFSDAPLLGRTVCLPLNTTRLENCKQDGLKAWEKHKHTRNCVVPLHPSSVEGKGPRVAAGHRRAALSEGVNQTHPVLLETNDVSSKSETQTKGHCSKEKILAFIPPD